MFFLILSLWVTNIYCNISLGNYRPANVKARWRWKSSVWKKKQHKITLSQKIQGIQAYLICENNSFTFIRSILYPWYYRKDLRSFEILKRIFETRSIIDSICKRSDVLVLFLLSHVIGYTIIMFIISVELISWCLFYIDKCSMFSWHSRSCKVDPPN